MKYVTSCFTLHLELVGFDGIAPTPRARKDPTADMGHGTIHIYETMKSTGRTVCTAWYSAVGAAGGKGVWFGRPGDGETLLLGAGGILSGVLDIGVGVVCGAIPLRGGSVRMHQTILQDKGSIKCYCMPPFSFGVHSIS